MRKLVKTSRRTAIITSIALTAASATTVAVVTSASASSGHPTHKAAFGECGLWTLQGTYLFHGDGTNVNNGVGSPLAYAGNITFDGAGNLSGYITTDVNGGEQSDRPYTGTYTVNSNCTGSYTILSTVHVPVSFDFFTSPSGMEYTYIQTQPGPPQFDVDSASAQRVSLG